MNKVKKENKLSNTLENGNIFFLLEPNGKYLPLIKNFISSFPNFKIDLYFWSKTKEAFYFKENKVKIEDKILFADGVVNLLSKDSKIYSIIGQKLEKLKLLKWQNSIATNLLFLNKESVKKLFSKFNIETPIFEKIQNKNSNKLFMNFPQPSRIFSKKNDFFSGKLNNIKEIDDIFNKNLNNINQYYIEEYIEGDNIYVFILKDDKKILQYNLLNEISFKNEDLKLISKLLKEAINNFGIEKYALFHLKYNFKKNKMYFLNIFVDLDIFFNSNKKYLDLIFEKYDLTSDTFLKNMFKK